MKFNINWVFPIASDRLASIISGEDENGDDDIIFLDSEIPVSVRYSERFLPTVTLEFKQFILGIANVGIADLRNSGRKGQTDEEPNAVETKLVLETG